MDGTETIKVDADWVLTFNPRSMRDSTSSRVPIALTNVSSASAFAARTATATQKLDDAKHRLTDVIGIAPDTTFTVQDVPADNIQAANRSLLAVN